MKTVLIFWGLVAFLGLIRGQNDDTENLDLQYGFNQKQRDEIIADHRKYRSEVKPTASDMKFIEWDPHLAELAYNWSLTCKEEHGMTDSIRGKVGQNIFWGPASLMMRATYYWHSEYVDYDYRTNRCKDGRMCGHYTGIVWADVQVMGCGTTTCSPDKTNVVCNYFPPFNIPDQKPFTEGPPCTRCDRGLGCRCYQNMCMTRRQCQRHNFNCKCNTVCLNCGVLDENECSCKCKSGWDGSDCSDICANEMHTLCGRNPGWFLPEHCDTDPEIKYRRCRQFCGQCKALDLSNPSDLCCDGTTCNAGESLNSDCKCVTVDEALKEAYALKLARESGGGNRIDVQNVTLPSPTEDEENTIFFWPKATSPKSSSRGTTCPTKSTTKSDSSSIGGQVLSLICLNFIVFTASLPQLHKMRNVIKIFI